MQKRMRLTAIILVVVLAMTACEKRIRQIPRSTESFGVTTTRTAATVTATVTYVSSNKTCTQTAIATPPNPNLNQNYPEISVSNNDKIQWKGMYNDTNHPAQIEVEFPAVPGLFKLATVGSPLRDMNGEPVNTLLSSGTGPTPAMGSSYSSVGQDFHLSSVIIFYGGTAYPCTPNINGLQGFGVHVQQ